MGEIQSAESLSRAMDAFAEISPHLTAAHIRTFLFVAERGICTQKDLELGLGMLNSGASRNVAFWVGNSKIGTSAPVPFLRSEVDPENRRFRLLSTTAKGRAFYKKISLIVSG